MDEAVAVAGLARLEPDLRAGERLLTLLGELAVRDDNRSAEGVSGSPRTSRSCGGWNSVRSRGIDLAEASVRSALASRPKTSCVMASSWCRAP